MSRKRVKKKQNGTGGRRKHFAPLVYQSFEDFERQAILPIADSDCFSGEGVALLAEEIMSELFEPYRNDEKAWKEYQEYCYNISNNHRKFHGFPMRRMVRHG